MVEADEGLQVNNNIGLVESLDLGQVNGWHLDVNVLNLVVLGEFIEGLNLLVETVSLRQQQQQRW